MWSNIAFFFLLALTGCGVDFNNSDGDTAVDTEETGTVETDDTVETSSNEIPDAVVKMTAEYGYGLDMDEGTGIECIAEAHVARPDLVLGTFVYYGLGDLSSATVVEKSYRQIVQDGVAMRCTYWADEPVYIHTPVSFSEEIVNGEVVDTAVAYAKLEDMRQSAWIYEHLACDLDNPGEDAQKETFCGGVENGNWFQTDCSGVYVPDPICEPDPDNGGEDDTGGTDTDSGGGGNTDDADGDGYTVTEGDCDDADYDINPGADEIDNNVDDDCDGKMDESDSSADADGDGYTEDEDDCNDGDASIHPGASDNTDDDVDNDCDGSVDEDYSSGSSSCASGTSKVSGSFTAPSGSTIVSISGEAVGGSNAFSWSTWSDGVPSGMDITISGNVVSFAHGSCTDDTSVWNASVTYTTSSGTTTWDCTGSSFTGTWSVTRDGSADTVSVSSNGSGCDAVW